MNNTINYYNQNAEYIKIRGKRNEYTDFWN